MNNKIYKVISVCHSHVPTSKFLVNPILYDIKSPEQPYSAYVIYSIDSLLPDSEPELSLKGCEPHNIFSHLQHDHTSILIIILDYSSIYGDTFKKIKHFFDIYKLKPEQCYFILMDKMQADELQETLKLQGIYIHVTARNSLLIDHTIQYTFPPIEIKKLFSIFCRSTREWRLRIFCELIDKGLLDKCIYSYMNSCSLDSNGTSLEQVTTSNVLKNMIPVSYSNEVKDKISKWVDGMPYAIEKNFGMHFSPVLFDAIAQSSIHIILETRNEANHFELTEKTWKPIAVKKPFLIFGHGGSLNQLRRRGYKTFSPFIDESYDLVDNTYLREQAVIIEMQRIASLSAQELFLLIAQCAAATEYNYQLLLKEQQYEWSDEFAKLGVVK